MSWDSGIFQNPDPGILKNLNLEFFVKFWTCGTQAWFSWEGPWHCGRRLWWGVGRPPRPHPPPGCLQGEICWAQLGGRGQLRTEEAEKALSTSFLRKTLSVCAVRGQAQVHLSRLEVIGPGGAPAAQRRNNALLLERRWAQQRRADALSNLLGKSLLRRGHFKLN